MDGERLQTTLMAKKRENHTGKREWGRPLKICGSSPLPLQTAIAPAAAAAVEANAA